MQPRESSPRAAQHRGAGTPMAHDMPRPVLLGLIGSPIAHSASPAMHEAAAEAVGLKAHYQLIDVANAGRRAVARLQSALAPIGFAGVNVTSPTRAVLPFLDALSPGARAVGAVNTIVVRDGRLTGHNTDHDPLCPAPSPKPSGRPPRDRGADRRRRRRQGGRGGARRPARPRGPAGRCDPAKAEAWRPRSKADLPATPPARLPPGRGAVEGASGSSTHADRDAAGPRNTPVPPRPAPPRHVGGGCGLFPALDAAAHRGGPDRRPHHDRARTRHPPGPRPFALFTAARRRPPPWSGPSTGQWPPLAA